MRKPVVSMKMDTGILEYVDQIAAQNQTSRSKTIELLINIVQSYFTNDQIYLEYTVHEEKDGRKKS